ncbi:uncharacterized protein LOC142984894 isoform X1 [Anticarsia gemmatalis]|uniref:uncharacterized protein LOC142984894 isoform X1 n=1 Tax=Anticarsia gemmatalis TaxID=129554 RepID=UPI003F76205E
MEAIFERLKKEGKNTVDSLIQWLKDAKLIDKTKAAEDKARELFSDVADKKNVEFQKFKEVVGKIADEKKKTFEELSKNLADEGQNFITNALASGASAIKDAIFGLSSSK